MAVTSGGAVRIAICDPLPLFRVGVMTAAAQDGITVDEPADVLGWAVQQPEPIVLISLTSPVQWDLLTRLHRESPNATVIGLHDDVTENLSLRAIMAGAVSVLPRDATPQVLCNVCMAVRQGIATLPIASLLELVRSGRRWAAEDVVLEERESAWLRRLAGGLTVAQIAEAAGYSERMMFRLLRDLYAKLGVSGRTEALLCAREHGWV